VFDFWKPGLLLVVTLAAVGCESGDGCEATATCTSQAASDAGARRNDAGPDVTSDRANVSPSPQSSDEPGDEPNDTPGADPRDEPSQPDPTKQPAIGPIEQLPLPEAGVEPGCVGDGCDSTPCVDDTCDEEPAIECTAAECDAGAPGSETDASVPPQPAVSCGSDCDAGCQGDDCVVGCAPGVFDESKFDEACFQ